MTRALLFRHYPTKLGSVLSIVIAALLIPGLTSPASPIPQDPENVTSMQLSEEQKSTGELIKHGIRNAQEGNYEKAIYDYNQALHVDPRDAEAYFLRGVARSKLGDERGANEDFEKVLRLRIEKLGQTIRRNPEDFIAHIQRGYSRYESGDQQGAIHDFTVAIRLRPAIADAYFYRGNAHYRKGDKQAAIQDYDRALQIDTKRADVYVARAVVRLELGDKPGAVEDFDKARNINPSDELH